MMQLARLFPQYPLAANSNARPAFALRVVAQQDEPASRSQPWSETVPNSAHSNLQTCGYPPSDLFDLAGLVGWLRTRFPTSTEYHVEAATGISAASVRNWLERRSRPSAENWSVLLCAFGPSLFAATVRRSAPWVERACETERLIEIDASLAALKAERERLMG